MAERHRTQTYLVALIVCLCVCSLILLNITQPSHPSMVSSPGIYTDSQEAFPQIDIEGEIVLFALVSLGPAGYKVSKCWTGCLIFRSIVLAPHFPPPKII
jgi:hypothetical protein